jgi:hypothetical protein
MKQESEKIAAEVGTPSEAEHPDFSGLPSCRFNTLSTIGHVSAGALDTPLYSPEDALTYAHNHDDGHRELVAEPGP